MGKAVMILNSLGGKENIEKLGFCITRLRVKVKDRFKLKTEDFKKLGSKGVLDFGDGNIHFVFGTESESIKQKIDHLIEKQSPISESAGCCGEYGGEFCEYLKSPMNGSFVGLELVNDPVFARRLMGDGIAISPTDGTVKSPFDGIVKNIFKTGHAMILESKNGLEVLIHIGIDTIDLLGEGFMPVVCEGQGINSGDVLLHFDIEVLKEKNKDLTTPIVVLNLADFENIKLEKTDKNDLNYETSIMKIGF